jgi:uncharacterized membrane protein YesL
VKAKPGVTARLPFGYQKENGLMTAIDRIGSAVLLGVLWLLCCAPVITIGASTAALYDTGRKRILMGEEAIFSTFFRSFKANFGQATILGLIGAAVVSLGGVTWLLFSDQGLMVTVPLLVMAIFALAIFFWCIPLSVRFTNHVWTHLRNGLSLALGHLGLTLALLVGAVLVAWGVFRLPPLGFVLPSGLMVVWAYWLEKVFIRHGYIQVDSDRAE